ncbi:bromodomain-containing protein DDB_G0270170-like [Episyrphus balteatus]|uniref:bromodomain-containing protein DDB_G0270170-like n=1 Tax=Episyrphus balteatus TaxID=286459 RepID=UPI002485D15E|nr:bromodomain-containing protein DDB_G0270170-like [Episyrphus balteatus]
MDYEHSEFLALSSASSNSLNNLNKIVNTTNDKIINNNNNDNNNNNVNIIETCSSPIDNSAENIAATPQHINNINNNNNNNFQSRSYSSSNSDEVSSTAAAPRNALFSCSTPVCLKLTTLPQFIPIDYQGQESSTSTSSMSSSSMSSSSGSSSVPTDGGGSGGSSSSSGGNSGNTTNNHLLITTTTTTTENVNPPDPDGKGGQEQTTTKTTTTTTTTAIPVSVPDLAKLNLTSPNGIVFKSGDLRMTMSELDQFVESAVAETLAAVEADKPKPGHRVKTPPPVGVNLGVTLKRVEPVKTQISVKNGPMLGVVLRKVEKKVEPIKSILDDDKPLYHLSIVRTGGDSPPKTKPKPKLKPKLPKPVPLQKVATIAAIPLTRPTTSAAATSGGAAAAAKPPATAATAAKLGVPPSPSGTALQKTKSAASIRPPRPQAGVPITIQKIEGDKIIIIKKIQIPKNSKVPAGFIQESQFPNTRAGKQVKKVVLDCG